MQKIVYIIPGFLESLKDGRYERLVKMFKQKEFKVIPVCIDWKYRTMSDYLKQFIKIYNENETENKVSEVHFFGFSFGAYIAFVSSTYLPVKSVFVASLSPYFKEDIEYLPTKWKKFIGEKRMKNFETFHFNKIVKNVNGKFYIFAGDKEGEQIRNRFLEAKNSIKNSKTFYIKNATHDIDNQEYFETINLVLEKDF